MKRKMIIVLALGILSSCSLFSKKQDKAPKGGLNLFTIEQDRQLGKQVADEIASKPNEYPVLDSASNVAAYQYIYKIRNTILNTGKVKHKDDFAWEVKIIKDDSTLNAFCTPGGHIYVYTGIIKYLENEAQLAGVMGHEMGHADLRHSTRQMTTMYGIDILVSAALGEKQALKQVTEGLIGLKFSRNHETEADRMSIEYLCPTNYIADGGAGFFEKIEASGSKTPPEFLSTHPSPAHRIENYHKWAKDNNCGGTQTYVTNYQQFQRLFK